MDEISNSGYAKTASAALLDALETDAPRAALQRVMAGMLERGMERDEILAVLDGVRHTLIETGRNDDEPLIVELLDGLNGWCRI